MKGKEETLFLADDTEIQAATKEGYRKGWNNRKEFDSGLIEEALRKSHDFEEFARILGERIAKEEGATE